MALFVESFLKPAVKGKATVAVYAFMDPERMDGLLGEFVKGVKGLDWGIGGEEGVEGGGGRFFGGSEEITFVEVSAVVSIARTMASFVKEEHG